MAYADEKRYWLDRFAQRDHRHLICKHRQVRDAAIKAGHVPRSGLQARMWKLALVDAAQTWDKQWKALFVTVRSRVGRRANFDEVDRHYANWLLAGYAQFFACLDGVATPPKFEIAEERRKKVVSFVRRAIRKLRGKNPMVRISRSAVFDADCYKVFEHEGEQYVKFMGLKSGQRIVVPLLGKTDVSGNIRLVLEADGSAEVHIPFALKKREIVADRAVGLDTGYTEAFVDSGGRAYGKGLGAILTRVSDERHTKGQARNKLRAIADKAVLTDPAKARRIQQNNLGNVKWDEREEATKASLECVINTGIHEVVEQHPGALLGTEDLRHTFTFDRGRKANRRAAGWVRGILQDRIQFMASAEGFRTEQVNAAYSSQGCPECGFVDAGNRRGDHFGCLHCRHEDHADRVGALNIEDRLDDPEITRFTPYREVKSILLARFHRRLEATGGTAFKVVNPRATVPGRTPDIEPSARPRPGIKTPVLMGRGSRKRAPLPPGGHSESETR
jgi:hypothetical protein